MSILQVEISEETMRQIEARAAARNLDLQSWMLELIENILLEEDNAAKWEEKKLLESLDSPMVEATSDWWENTIADLNREANQQRDLPKYTA